MSKKNNGIQKLLIFGLILLIVGGLAAWFIFTEKFEDTKSQKADYTISAYQLIHEFQKADSLSNKKYAEKIMTIQGKVSEIENVDTSVNIKMTDTTNGSYVIFAFQPQHLSEAKSIHIGDIISIKGSCSGGAYSQILETEFITFKRCTLIK